MGKCHVCGIDVSVICARCDKPICKEHRKVWESYGGLDGAYNEEFVCHPCFSDLDH